MKKLVSIARALKEKNRVAGRLAKAREIIGKENSREKKIPRSIDVATMMEGAKSFQAQLIAIKSAIAKANGQIIDKIIALDEIKSEIAFLSNLDVKEGIFEEASYSGHVVKEFDAVFKQADVLAKIAVLQKEADALQDALDDFNAVSKVEIEITD